MLIVDESMSEAVRTVCRRAAVDLPDSVDSFTRPGMLGADLEEQTRARRLDLPYLGVKA
jgi:hypothetical protein